jgi:hypothetical protein
MHPWPADLGTDFGPSLDQFRVIVSRIVPPISRLP